MSESGVKDSKRVLTHLLTQTLSTTTTWPIYYHLANFVVTKLVRLQSNIKEREEGKKAEKKETIQLRFRRIYFICFDCESILLI